MHLCDLHDPETLKGVMEGIDIVYFLVHSMADQANLVERERAAARNVQQALKAQALNMLSISVHYNTGIPIHHT